MREREKERESYIYIYGESGVTWGVTECDMSAYIYIYIIDRKMSSINADM